MCGRIFVDDDTLREIEKIVKNIDAKRAKRGEVHPSEPAVVLCAQKESSASSSDGITAFAFIEILIIQF